MRSVNNASAFLKVGSVHHVMNIKIAPTSQFKPICKGCDCDENSPNPDELCPANQKCKKCKCLLEGISFIIFLINISVNDLFMKDVIVMKTLSTQMSCVQQMKNARIVNV